VYLVVLAFVGRQVLCAAAALELLLVLAWAASTGQ
jgi:hypothetical protein